MIKIAIFGITGQTGKNILEIVSNNSNYKIKALIRKNTSTSSNFQNINYIVGDILNQNDVDKNIENCDCVISVIGHKKNSNSELQTLAIKNIINSMKKYNVKRIISLTGTGVRISGDKISLIDKLANFIIKKVDSKRISDGINHYNILKNTDLDWTILRVLKLTNINKIEKYTLTENGPAKTFISRKTVAKIIIDLIDDKVFLKKLPVISK
ncbi:MAG TPA: NAD(P)H-binding protein [Candidatus Paceibacterota bacterium]|nr:NAD(P)H-binding protein [Candidatus Paceibacterota bacterium]HMP18888.1 NAD(P)H-binding protein [Candidatus Paceibacterota bacterium]HMP85049.1 NAD(P)H-binding protein [Candidatus Paceibacterota bacterium]